MNSLKWTWKDRLRRCKSLARSAILKCGRRSENRNCRQAVRHRQSKEARMPDDNTEASGSSEQAVESTEVPDTGQTEEAQESFTDFDPAKDIPEDADKAWFEKQYNELRSGWTQKTQGLARERQEAQEYRDFLTAIQNDPAARDAWLQQEFG